MTGGTASGEAVQPSIASSHYERSAVYAYAQTLPPLSLFLVLLVIARHIEPIFGIIITFVLIGLVQYRLYFPLHDCPHMSLFRSRSENLFFGHLCGGILFVTFDGFRNEHIKHHKKYGTREDPGGIDYWVRLDSRRDMVLFFLAPFGGGSLLSRIRANYKFVLDSKEKDGYHADAGSLANWPALLILLLIQAGVCLYVTEWLLQPWRYVVFSLLPGATIFLFLSRLRMFLEHGSIDYSRFDYLTAPRITARTIFSRPPESLFLCGMNFNYHHEHHLFPGVSSCHLKRLYEEVTKATIQPDDFAQSYLGALQELWRNLAKARRGAQTDSGDRPC